jgi:hypothetical protein
MFERSRQSGENSQIQDPEEVNFAVVNTPYRLLSGSERDVFNQNHCETPELHRCTQNTVQDTFFLKTLF